MVLEIRLFKNLQTFPFIPEQIYKSNFFYKQI